MYQSKTQRTTQDAQNEQPGGYPYSAAVSDLRLRHARPEDLPEVTTLYRQLSPYSPELSPEVARTTWEVLLADPKIHVLVAERGEILGTVTLIVVPNLMQGARSYGLIENVVTREDVRGQGIGSALMSSVMDLARTLNMYKVMLVTGRQAPEVHRLYLKSGLTSDAVAYRARFDP